MSNPAPPGRDDDRVEAHADPGLDIEVLRRRREIVLTVLALVAILGLAAITAYHFYGSRPMDPAELRGHAMQMIRASFDPGIALQFSSTSDTQVEILGEGAVALSGEVVAVTPQGLAEYYRFRCTFTQADGGRWQPDKLEVKPQN